MVGLLAGFHLVSDVIYFVPCVLLSVTCLSFVKQH